MKRFASRASVVVTALAAFAMVASPVMARGWGDRDRHYQHKRDGIDGGDILAGLLVIGGIAAIASAASKSSKDKQEQQQEPYRYPGGPTPGSPEDGSYGDERSAPAPQGADSGTWRASSRGSMDMAADICVDEIERGERQVETIDSVNRADDGYRVDGKMADGRGFTCQVDRGGRIRQLAVDGQAMI